MKKNGKLIVGIVLVSIVVIFSALNTASVRVNFGLGSVTSPLIFVILGSTMLGLLIGLVTWVPSNWSRGKKLKKLQQTSDQEVAERAQVLLNKDQEIKELKQQIAELTKVPDVEIIEQLPAGASTIEDETKVF